GSLEIRQSPIVEAVVGKPLLAEASLPFSWPIALSEAATEDGGATDVPALARVDSRPQRILLFGDSMIDELMLRLAGYCLESGHTLQPAVWYGAGTVHWAGDGKLKQLLQSFQPTYAIVVLGSNELTSRNVKEHEVAVRRIIATLGDIPFVWVGPPNWEKDTGINDLIARTAGAG